MNRVGAVVRKNLLTIKQDLHLSMLIITHDIALAQEVCYDVLVMYAGQVLEHNADNLAQTATSVYQRIFAGFAKEWSAGYSRQGSCSGRKLYRL